MKNVFHKTYESSQKEILGFIESFNVSGEIFGKANRNTIKLFKLEDQVINIKSFKVPNIFNQIAYKFLRKRLFLFTEKSKGRRFMAPTLVW